MTFKAGDIIKDSLNWEWIFFNHKGKLSLYPLEFYNDGRLSEKKGGCSFIHNPKKWDLSQVKLTSSSSMKKRD